MTHSFLKTEVCKSAEEGQTRNVELQGKRKDYGVGVADREEIVAVRVRLYKIRSSINLVSYRLILCMVKFSSLGFSEGCLRLVLRTCERTHEPLACGSFSSQFTSAGKAQLFPIWVSEQNKCIENNGITKLLVHQ